MKLISILIFVLLLLGCEQPSSPTCIEILSVKTSEYKGVSTYKSKVITFDIYNNCPKDINLVKVVVSLDTEKGSLQYAPKIFSSRDYGGPLNPKHLWNSSSAHFIVVEGTKSKFPSIENLKVEVTEFE